MENYKVCILAAGIGSRSFDPNINKSLLPLDGKAVISNIINKFDQNQKFVVALGYLSDQVKQYILVNKGWSIIHRFSLLSDELLVFFKKSIIILNLKTLIY